MKNLYKLRTSRGLTQRDVGDLLGVHPSTVGHWESGRATPEAQHLNALCEAFKVTREFMMDLRGAGPTRGANLRRVA